MIDLRNVSFGYEEGNSIVAALDCRLPTDRRFVLYSETGGGKTTLIRGLAGLLQPQSGEVVRYCRLSFPIGHSAGFRGDLTVADNIRLAADSFEADHPDLYAFTDSFPGLNAPMALRFSALPANLQTRISYVIAYGIPFDCFLFDGPIAIGDQPFRDACMQAFSDRCQHGYIMATRALAHAEAYGDCGGVIRGGGLELFDDIAGLVRGVRATRSLPRTG